MMIQPLSNEGSSSEKLSNTSNFLDKDMFLKLLVAELSHQDPTEPMSNRDFVTQLAQFSSLEQLNNLNSGVNSLLQAQLLLQGSQLIGHQVEGINPLTGEEIRGKVSEVCWEEGNCYLKVGEKYIPINYITRVLSD